MTHPQTQLSRCFIQPIEEPIEPWKSKKHKRTWEDEIPKGMIKLLRPWAHPYLVFDTETLTGAASGQQAKIGFWQERGLRYADRCNLWNEDPSKNRLTVEKMDRCWRKGVFYNPKTCTPKEIEIVKAYASKHGLFVCDMEYFIKSVFYRQSKLTKSIPEPKLIIGHNLPFDVGAISSKTAKSRDPKMYGALSLRLCNCENIDPKTEKPYPSCRYHPPVKILKIGLGKHWIKCGSKFDSMSAGLPKYEKSQLEFLDTRMLAGALLGAPGPKGLGALCEMLGTETQKGKDAEHGKEITETYLDYARDDVQCTWELWLKLRHLYWQHGLEKRITYMFSEASVGKAYYDEFGVQSFFGYDHKTKTNTRNLEFDPADIGASMEGYFGGRSEARIRHKITEGMHADFRSQYPSTNALMKTQDLLLCEQLDVVRGSDTAAKRFLEGVTLDDLQRKETWPRLRGFARIRPNGDVLPFRCEFEGEPNIFELYADDAAVKSINVGIEYVKSACDAWYSFADIVASILLTGKCPEILETIEFIPIGRQTTNLVKLFGDENYVIDLSEGKDDLFTKVIELRTTVKRDRDLHPKGSTEYERLDAMQLALKLLANATSYGVLVEVIVEEREKEVSCMVYHGGETTRRAARRDIITPEGDLIPGFKAEKPGKFFAPYGGLIPAGGRLLLALAETLAKREGLLYVFCDTDSMFFGRPENMPRKTFREKVLRIAGKDGWFQPLSPYSDGGTFFALEDVNYKLLDDTSGKVGKAFEPLYCLAISAKRYDLFNIGTKNETIIRKISGHGLGDLRRLDDYDPSKHKLTKAEHVAAPVTKLSGRKYGDLVHGSTPRLLCDIWRIATDCFRNGTQKDINSIIGKLPQLQAVQYSQVALSSTHLLKLYPNLPNRRGFQFFAAFPAPQCSIKGGDPSKYVQAPYDEHKALCGGSLYASVPPGGLTPELIEEWRETKTGIFRRDNNEFPHGLFDPAWKLSLKTMAQKLVGYFDHPELKSVGKEGELSRRIIVSIDKHFIGKETSPLDDDNDMIDDEPITTSSDLVLRSETRNLQPLIDAGVALPSRLTFGTINAMKASVELHNDGTLSKREPDDPAQIEYLKARKIQRKTWRLLRSFGKFAEVSKLSGVSVPDLEYGAKFGGQDWNSERCEWTPSIDWKAIRSAIEDLSGWTRRKATLATKKKAAVVRVTEARDRSLAEVCDRALAREASKGLAAIIVTSPNVPTKPMDPWWLDARMNESSQARKRMAKMRASRKAEGASVEDHFAVLDKRAIDPNEWVKVPDGKGGWKSIRVIDALHHP